MEFQLNNVPSGKGKVAIVTGANTGLGYETALGLANCGFEVVLACRNKDKATAAQRRIESEVENARISFIPLDLNDLASVRAFAKAFEDKYQRLDILVENAGIMMLPFQKTVDGFESQFGINFLSHFLLTKRLFARIASTAQSRIVSLSSVAHKKGRIHFSDLQSSQKYSKFGAYAQSKLACFMFGYEMHRRIDRKGLGVKSIIAHPGGSDTELGRHLSPFWYKLFLPIILMFTHSPKQAALPSLMASLDARVQNGDFIGPMGFAELKGKPGIVKADSHAYSIEHAKKLWQKAEQLIGEKFEI
jgi:NAD(P)-dependent dehydrogenase (short-subunit alcohol dehydrogenase family)